MVVKFMRRWIVIGLTSVSSAEITKLMAGNSKVGGQSIEVQHIVTTALDGCFGEDNSTDCIRERPSRPYCQFLYKGIET